MKVRFRGAYRDLLLLRWRESRTPTRTARGNRAVESLVSNKYLVRVMHAERNSVSVIARSIEDVMARNDSGNAPVFFDQDCGTRAQFPGNRINIVIDIDGRKTFVHNFADRRFQQVPI